MKRFLTIISIIALISTVFAADLEDSYIYIYTTSQFEQENPDDYNGSATDATNGDFEKAEIGTVTSLSIGGKITAPEVYDQCTLTYSIDGSKTVHQVEIPIYEGSQIGTNTIFESIEGNNIDLSSLQAGVHSLSVSFTVSSSDSKIVSLIDPASGGYSADFTIAESPAPISLSSFTAKVMKGKVELAWVTESETENSHFLVYRDGEVIGRVEGNGTTAEQHSYTFLDTRVQGGIHSYAIADVTYGGVEELHDAVVVEVGAEIAEADFVLNKAYPNPFNPSTVISMHYAVGSNSVVNIYNTQGVLVKKLANGFVEAGHHEVIWDASNMTSGVYIVKMIVGDVVQSQKLVLLK